MRRSVNDAASKSAASRGRADEAVGALPEWDLTALYRDMDDPAIGEDLQAAESEAVAFEAAFKGRLEAVTRGPGATADLMDAVTRFERLEDRLGRLASYAGLVYAGDTTDPKRVKFYGDIQEKITAISSHLLFFTLD